MSIFRRQPPLPPPDPIYKRNPIATAAVILTIIGMFVLGPVGVIYNIMAEELKGKADNATVILMMKQFKETDDRQWKEIERNRDQQQVAKAQPQVMNVIKLKLKEVSIELFEKYIKLDADVKKKYKEYLKSKGYDTEGLPN